jgi:tRNA pseudouridine55 synthase
VTTDTGDADGTVLEERSAAAVDVAAIDAVLPRFRGEIEQVPPMYSALKRNGVPLYELARAGQVVEREARRITVHSLEREGFEGGERASLVLRVGASKGTYIRVLAEDIGAALGCGAHVATLRRSRAGPFSDADAVSLDVLEELRANRAFEELDRYLLPASRALGHLPEVRLAESVCFTSRRDRR